MLFSSYIINIFFAIKLCVCALRSVRFSGFVQVLTENRENHLRPCICDLRKKVKGTCTVITVVI